MNAVLGNGLAVLFVAGLVALAIREILKSHKKGGCCGCSSGSCAGCGSHCEAAGHAEGKTSS